MNPQPNHFTNYAPESYDEGRRMGLVNVGYDNPIDNTHWFDIHQDRKLAPEQELLMAVLEEAILCATCAPSVWQNSRRKKDQKEARAWIARRDCWGVFSFVSCCESIGLEPDAVRRMIEKRY